jgi:hypothetical protein
MTKKKHYHSTSSDFSKRKLKERVDYLQNKKNLSFQERLLLAHLTTVQLMNKVINKIIDKKH